MEYEFNTDGEACSIEALGNELTTLAGHLNAGAYRFLELLAEFDARQGFAGSGAASCAHWVSWRCGFGIVAAREKVRAARALRELPLISEAMRRGVISYCKVRALARVATAATESSLLNIAEAGTVAHVEKTVRLMRRVERKEELARGNARHSSRFLQVRVVDDGCVALNAMLAPEQGRSSSGRSA